MRTFGWILPLALVAVVAAQDEEVDALVAKLGHESFDEREAATKALIERGEEAVPALERAVESEDLEVRLRAGRALRAIRGPRREEREAEREDAAASSTVARNVQVEVRDGKTKVTVKSTRDGEEEVRTFEGESLEALKRDHPEVREALGGVSFGFRELAPGDLGLDDLLRGFGPDPFLREEFWGDMEEQMQRSLREMRELQDHLRRRWDPMAPRRPQGEAQQSLLGARVAQPDAVLDAQLGLEGKGLVIHQVVDGSLADRLGLQRHDVLLELNGVAVKDAEDVARSLTGDRPDGQPHSALAVRRAKPLQLTAK